MVAWPTTGGSEGTWNDEMDAFVSAEHTSVGTHNGAIAYPVDGISTVVLTKYLTGTLDADSSTSVAHGITGVDNILHVSGAVFNAVSSYLIGDFRGEVKSATLEFELSWGDTNVVFSNVGTTLQSQKYRIKIDYIIS